MTIPDLLAYLVKSKRTSNSGGANADYMPYYEEADMSSGEASWDENQSDCKFES